MKDNNGPSPAVRTAKKRENTGYPKEVVLSTGERAIIRSVSASLISEVTSLIENPKVPKVWLEEKQREEENPNHPDYLAALDQAERKRGLAAIDAMVMFGVELLDGLPEDDGWLRRLKFLEKRGLLHLESYDLDDPLDKEFLYKRFIAVDTDTLNLVGEASGVNPEEIERQEESFPGS